MADTDPPDTMPAPALFGAAPVEGMKRVWLRAASDPHTHEDGSLFIDETILRAAAVAIASHATNGTHGRGVGDPVFERVTEGRQKAQNEAQAKNPRLVHYSACGDLVHYVLRCLGERRESLVNRSDDGGDHPWQVSVNISRIVGAPGIRTPKPGASDRPGKGDPMLVFSPWHALICDAWEENHDLVATIGAVRAYEYGQWTKDLGDCGLYKQHALSRRGADFMVHARALRHWLPLTSLVLTESAIVPEGFAMGVPDDNPYPEPGVPVS